MTGRNIPIQLATMFSGSAQTWTRVLRFTPFGVAPFGITTHDIDLTYDANDGVGAVVYRAKRGYVSSAQVSTSDLSVDNSEAEALLAEFQLDGITQDMIKRGVMDDAEYVELLVNYNDLTAGRHVVLGSGTVGEARAEKGLSAYIELRSLSNTLKQNSIVELGSVNCRAKFGDERCKFDVDSLLVSGDVDSVGAETDRVFSFNLTSGMSDETGHYVPGLVFWTSGDNETRSYEIEAYEVDSSGMATVTLAFPTDEPIQPNDEFDIREDCNKSWGTGINNCLTFNNRPNFRGEPFRPVADGGTLSVPGGPGGGSSGAGATQTVAES